MKTYYIYPTLMDSFSYYKESESMTEQELIDRINRKQPATKEMLQGSAFNELVDGLCDGKPYPLNYCDNKESYRIEYNGFSYIFPKDITDHFVSVYRNSIRQMRLRGEIDTRYGNVIIYGYADGVTINDARDIKTCREYRSGKYRKSWQRYVYTYCLRKMGCNPERFIFDITDFRNIYREEYPCGDTDMRELVNGLEELICFLEKNNGRITQRKIFGEFSDGGDE